MGNYKLYYSKILDKEQHGIKLKHEESVESSLEMCSFSVQLLVSIDSTVLEVPTSVPRIPRMKYL